MTPGLATVVKAAERGPDSPLVRRVLGALVATLGVASFALLALSSTQRADHGPLLFAAGATCLVLAPALVASGRLLRGAPLRAAAGVALGASSAAVVLATGGAHGMFNLAVPVIVLAVTALTPFRYAATVTAVVLAAHIVGTILHDGLAGHAGYELAEALGIAVAALFGVHALRRSLLRHADALEARNSLLDARVRELDALHDLALSAGASISQQDLAGRGLSVALHLSGAQAGVLWLKNADGWFEAAAIRGCGDHPTGWSAPRRLDDLGPAAMAIRERRTVTTSTVDEVVRAVFGADAPEPVAATQGHATPGPAAPGPPAPGLSPDNGRGLLGAVASVTPLLAAGTVVGVLSTVDRTGRTPDANAVAALETLAVELALVLDRKRKTLKVEHQRRQLEALSQIASRVTASLDVQEVLDYTVAQTSTLLGAEISFIATRVEATEDLQIVSHEGFSTTSMVRLVIEKGRGIGGRVVKDQRVHQSVDYCQDGRLEDDYKRAVGDEGIVTLIGAPLVNRGKVVGVLYAARRHRRVFNADESHLLSMLGTQVAVALDNARLFQDVQEQSVRDPLTGAYNRRFFDQRLAEEAARSRRSGDPCSLLIIDVDDFKNYNDTHGHARGDILLKELVSLCADSVRTSDVVGRYGGEEFVVLFPATDLSAAMVVAARVQATVRRTLGARLGAAGVSVSGGVAELGAQDGEPTGLVERADRALYRAKAAGKDRICVDRTPVDPPEVERNSPDARSACRPLPRQG